MCDLKTEDMICFMSYESYFCPTAFLYLVPCCAR